jgi:hypothetical protein
VAADQGREHVPAAEALAALGTRAATFARRSS